MSRHESESSSLAWFFAGAAIGAAAALLTAPRPGRETREVLRKRVVEGREKLYESGRDAMERGRELYDRGRHMVEEATESGRGVVEKGREYYEKGKHVVEEAASSWRSPESSEQPTGETPRAEG